MTTRTYSQWSCLLAAAAIPLLLTTSAFAREKDAKLRYLGTYEAELNFFGNPDSISKTLFFTHDSFLMVIMIKHDSDYLYPMFRGRWVLTESEDSTYGELHFLNGSTERGRFETNENGSFSFYFQGASFYQPIRIIRRRTTPPKHRRH